MEENPPPQVKLSELPINCLFRFDQAKSGAVVEKLLQLLQLFVTPHILDVPPMTTVSFLKQWESFVAKQEEVGMEVLMHGLERLQLRFINIDPQTHSFYINTQVAELAGERNIFSANLLRSIQEWRTQPQEVLLLSLSLQQVDEGFRVFGHKVFVALKKGPVVQMLYIDSHGSEEAIQGQNLFVQHLQPLLGPVEIVLSECPTLQLSEHGGNCVQWFLLLFTMFVCNPGSLFQPTALLQSLQTHASINILFFSLFLFCEYLSENGNLNPVFYSLFKTRKHVSDVILEAHKEDEIMRGELSAVLPVTNCPTYAFHSCPVGECQKCQGICAYQVSVISGEPCQHLSPLQIAQKMVVLCNQLSAEGLHVANVGRDPVLHVPTTIEDFRQFVFPLSGVLFEDFAKELVQVANYQRLYTQFEKLRGTVLPTLRQHANFVSPRNLNSAQQLVDSLAVQVNQIKSRIAQSEPYIHFPVRYLVTLRELYDKANNVVTKLVQQEERGVDDMIRDTTNYVVAQRSNADNEAIRSKVTHLFDQFESMWNDYMFIQEAAGTNLALASFKDQLLHMAPLFRERPTKRVKTE